MKFLTNLSYSVEFDCPYLPASKARYKMFHATDLAEMELEKLLSNGYRKFGTFFFRPACTNCRECIPIRTQTDTIFPSKSQKRALRKAQNVSVTFSEPEYKKEIFDIYCNHTKRFKEKKCSLDDFLQTFYLRYMNKIQCKIQE